MELPFWITTSDLWLLLFCFGPVLVLGVPAVRKTRTPRELALEPVADDALPASLRRWFAGLDARFAPLGYVARGNWRATNLPNQIAVLRGWSSSSEPAVASANALLDVREHAQIGTSWLEFSTLFEDGTLVGTASLRRSRWRRRHHTVGKMHDAPGVTDPARLKARHERNCAPYLAHGPRHLQPEAIVPEFVAFSRRDAEWRRAKGLWKSYPDGDGPTLRGALLLTLDALSPLTAEVGLARLAAAVGLAFALPFLAEGPLVASAVLPPGLGRAAAGIGALALGGLLSTRAVFWGPALLWAGLRVAGGETGNPFFFCFVVQSAVLASSSLASRIAAKL
jgi:hypothetical protein